MRPGATRNRLSVRRLAVLMVCLGGLLAGCDRTPEPTPTASTIATSTTASPSSTTTAPTTTTPAPTTPNLTDDEQAIQAVQRYYAEFNKALRTLKTADLRKFYKPGCLICEQDAATIDGMAAAGRTHVGGDVRIVDARVTTSAPGSRIVHATVVADPLIIRDAAGTTVKEYPAARSQKDFSLVTVTNGWVLEGMT